VLGIYQGVMKEQSSIIGSKQCFRWGVFSLNRFYAKIWTS